MGKLGEIGKKCKNIKMQSLKKKIIRNVIFNVF